MRRHAARGCLIAVLMLPLGCKKEGPAPDEAQMQKLFAEARKLDEQGRYHEAMVRYETILAHHPEWMSTRLNAAMAAYDSGQYSKAAGHFELLHKYGPTDWFVIRKLIQCHERLGEKDQVDRYRKKLAALRTLKKGSQVLKQYQGFTRDYIPVGTMHLIGYEFFDPGKHGRLWYFKLENRRRKPISSFLVEASPFFTKSGQRLFYLTESCQGWLRIWYVGVEGRDYHWARKRVLEVLKGKRQPLVVKPLPPDLEVLNVPGGGAPPKTGKKEEGSSKEKSGKK